MSEDLIAQYRGRLEESTDLCALTDEMLPLYTEGTLPPETRRRIDDHAAECPVCQERLAQAAATLSPPPGAQVRAENPRLQLSTRMRRLLLYGLVVILIGAVGAGYMLTRPDPWKVAMIPARVKTADEVAARGVPGWNRAKAAGLVVDIGITEKIAGTDATVTLDKAWYSGRQVYILYTVKAPQDRYLLATVAFLGTQDSTAPPLYGGTDWNHLSQWGGFSPEGFHGVLSFPQLVAGPDTAQLKLMIRRWAPVTPETGLVERPSMAGELNVVLPWQSAYMNEHVPEGAAWGRQQTWMGRTLAVDWLWVGFGSTTLNGRIDLPPGESSPGLNARLLVAGKALDLKAFSTERGATAGSYKFTATFDGVDRWPAPVKLEVTGISFGTVRTLEWPVNWPKYRDMAYPNHRLMDPADQVTIRFYDSQLTSIMTTATSMSIEQKDPARPPYVRANIGFGGRGLTVGGPGMELVNDRGEVLTNLGGAAGTIYDDVKGHDQRQGVAAVWENTLPESFRQSERLVLRYVDPSATMVLNDTWELRAAH